MWFFALVLIILLPGICKILITIYERISLERKLNKMFVQLPGYPLVENFFEFVNASNLLDICMNVNRKYGTIVKLSIIYGRPGLLVTDLKMLEFILSSTHVLNKYFGYAHLRKWLGKGLITSNGSKWRKDRKMITPTFHFQILKQYFTNFHSASDILIKELKKQCGKGSFDIHSYLSLCSLDIICETAMGTKVNAQGKSKSEYVIGVQEICRIALERTVELLKHFDFTFRFTKDYHKENYYLKVLSDHAQNIIATKRKEMKMNKQKNDQYEKGKISFIDLLLQAELDGQTMTDEEIREEVATFMFAGHDTTASGVTFTLYCLAANPDLQARAFDEISMIFGSDKTRQATFAEMNKLQYLEMAIKEALRLYPTIPIATRITCNDVQYDDKIILPKGTNILMFFYGLHRDPNLYPDPEKFDPERFSPENRLSRNRFSYLAFSAGPRNCIGQKYAMLEMKYILSLILRNFLIKPAPNFVPKLAAFTTLRSINGVLVQLEERI